MLLQETGIDLSLKTYCLYSTLLVVQLYRGFCVMTKQLFGKMEGLKLRNWLKRKNGRMLKSTYLAWRMEMEVGLHHGWHPEGRPPEGFGYMDFLKKEAPEAPLWKASGEAPRGVPSKFAARGRRGGGHNSCLPAGSLSSACWGHSDRRTMCTSKTFDSYFFNTVLLPWIWVR